MKCRTLLLAHMRRHPTGSSTVTAVSLWYNSQNVSLYGGLLGFTGTTYQLTAKDQNGNALSNGSGTWAATDATNFPVNSSGLVSPAAGVGGGTVTFTHTASGKVGTVPISVIKTPSAIYKQDAGSNYASTGTTGLMANINTGLAVDPNYQSGTPTPTGSGALYTDGLGVNHYSVDSTTADRQFMGSPSLVYTLASTSNGDGQLSTGVSGFTRAWGLQLLRFDPGFTMLGTGVGAAAFKIGNWFIFNPGGRTGMELTNGNSSGGTGGSPGGNFDCGSQLVNDGTVEGGGPSTTLPAVTTEFSAGEVWCSLLLYEVRGGNIMSARVGWFKIGSVPTLTFGQSLGVSAVEGPMVGGASRVASPAVPSEYQPTPVNYNQSPVVTNLYVSLPLWQVVNGDLAADPYGVLNDASSQTLTGIAGGTVTRGHTADAVVLTGTNFTKNCDVVFSNAKIYPQSITINSTTQMTVVVAVDPTATTGAGTVLVRKGGPAGSTSGTQAVTVA